MTMLRSVRVRLTVWYTLILALVLVTFSGISYVLLSRAIRSATDRSLSDMANELAASFRAAPPARHDRDPRLDVRFAGREVFLLDGANAIVATSRPSLPPADHDRAAQALRRGIANVATIDGGAEGDGLRIVVTPATVGATPRRVAVVQDLDPQADRLEQAELAVLLGIPLALLVAAGGGYLLARKSLAPVLAMSAKARQIGAETLDERIAVADQRDELGFLAMTLNDLLERLQRAFASQRSFMADASHELRTPAAIIKGEADVALSRPRSAEEYRGSVEVIGKAATKLTRIVDDLFLLARTDAGSYPMQRSRFYLDELLADAVRAVQSLADAKQLAITCRAPRDVVVNGDEELLQRLLLNLLDNAIKFTPNGGSVLMEATVDGATCAIRVTDSGAGIAADDQPRIFERFFRSSARRPESGAGLGLPIARWIAELHGGTVRLERSDADGSRFVASIRHQG